MTPPAPARLLLEISAVRVWAVPVTRTGRCDAEARSSHESPPGNAAGPGTGPAGVPEISPGPSESVHSRDSDGPMLR